LIVSGRDGKRRRTKGKKRIIRGLGKKKRKRKRKKASTFAHEVT